MENVQNPPSNFAQKTISALRDGQAGILEDLYDQFRPDFLSWAGKRFRATPGDLEDAWQDAVVVFYEKVMSGRLTTLSCTVRTYLFAVGYKRLLKNYRKVRRYLWLDAIDKALKNSPELALIDLDDRWEEERDLLLAAMEQISPRCRELLLERYFEEKSINDLMQHFEYASHNSVSVTLANCLAKLKRIIQEKSNT